MMIGNSYGIAMSAFASRMRGKPIARSSLGYELAMLSSIVVLFPAALLNALAAGVARAPIISFPAP